MFLFFRFDEFADVENFLKLEVDGQFFLHFSFGRGFDGFVVFYFAARIEVEVFVSDIFEEELVLVRDNQPDSDFVFEGHWGNYSMGNEV